MHLQSDARRAAGRLRRAVRGSGGASWGAAARPSDKPGSPEELVLQNRPRGVTDPALRARLSEVIGPSLSPVFVLAPQHSGLAALRTALAEHPDVYAPDELPFAAPAVQVGTAAGKALARHGVDQGDLEHMLWDRLLRELFARSGKSVAVLTTQGMGRYWRHLKWAWPGARFVYLIRDPLVVASLTAGASSHRGAAPTRRTQDLLECVRDARTCVPGLTLRFEEVRDDPDASMRQLFEVLDVRPDACVLETLRNGIKEVADPHVGQQAGLTDALKGVRREWGYA